MKILLVRTSSMGDLVHTLPAIEDLAHAHPSIELHWLCEEAFTDIAKLHPFIKKTHALAWRRWRKNLVSRETWQEIFNLRRTLDTERYDKILDAQGLLKSVLFARMAGNRISGMDKYSARESFASYFYHEKFFIPKEHNAIWRNRKLFAQIFAYNFDENKIVFGAQSPGNLDLISLPTAYHVCLSAASRNNKLWNEENWRTLFVLMHQSDNLPIYLPFGNEDERLRAERLAQNFAFVNICPKLNLRKLASILASSTSVIGVDTGLLHLANAFNRPCVGIFTATSPQKTGVQTGPNAVNIGGIGTMPSAGEVLSAWQQIKKS